jgi:hypothetical protein
VGSVKKIKVTKTEAPASANEDPGEKILEAGDVLFGNQQPAEQDSRNLKIQYLEREIA